MRAPLTSILRVLSLTLFIMPLSVSAQGAGHHHACRADVERLCGDVKGDRAQVMACLVENVDTLNTACASALDRAAQQWEEIYLACGGDAELFCPDAADGKGGVMRCLVKHEQDISARCKTKLQGHMHKHRMAKHMQRACGQDLKTHCAEITPGEGRIMACLNNKVDVLSESCQGLVTRIASERAAVSQACGSDIDKHCPDALSGGDLKRCLTTHRANLSSTCQTHLAERQRKHKNMRDFRRACGKDVRSHCQGVKPGQGRIAQCLMDHEDKLSQGCLDLLDEF